VLSGSLVRAGHPTDNTVRLHRDDRPVGHHGSRYSAHGLRHRVPWHFLTIGLVFGLAGSCSVARLYVARWFPKNRQGFGYGIFGAR
jgi:MFS-type transporter involved in bile tolerance (Atg22 family)